MSLKDINFKSPRLAIYFNNDLFYNKSLNNISLGVVPQRDIILFASDLFLGVWQFISSLAIYFGPAKSLIRRVLSPHGSPAIASSQSSSFLDRLVLLRSLSLSLIASMASLVISPIYLV